MKHVTRSKRARVASYIGRPRRATGTRNERHEHVMTTTHMGRTWYRQTCRTCPKMTKWMKRALPIALVDKNAFANPTTTVQNTKDLAATTGRPVVIAGAGTTEPTVIDANGDGMALDAYREARSARLGAYPVKELQRLCGVAGIRFKARDTKPTLIAALVEYGVKEFPAKMAALHGVTPGEGATTPTA